MAVAAKMQIEFLFCNTKESWRAFSNCQFNYDFRNCAGTQTCSSENYEDILEYYNAEVKPKKTSWFGRILRFFLPVQFFLMVMLFLAWHSTSDHHLGYYHHGCEASRFHFLYPQLKYINGPPPI